MSEEKNDSLELSGNNKLSALSLPPNQITKPKIQAFFNTELIRRNYRAIISGLEATKPNKENLEECNKVVKAAEKFLSDMEDVRKSVSDPYFKAFKEIKAVFDEAVLPVLLAVTPLKAEIKTNNEALAAERKKAEMENARRELIEATMVSFINSITIEIGNAQDDTDISRIQMRIGSEKSRGNLYQERLDDFKLMCDSLTPIINQRKETIRKAKELMKIQRQALESGDVEKVTEVQEQLDFLGDRMEENIIRLQEKAFEQATTIDSKVAEPMGKTLAGRNYWKWRVDDMKKLQKKMPELVMLVPNKEAIEKLLSEKRADGSLVGQTEVQINGLVFYLQNQL